MENTVPEPTKSTTVRAIQFGLSTVGRIHGDTAARWATSLFFRTPARYPSKGRELSTLERGQRFSFEGSQGELVAWRWGSGRPILLQHGWGGAAAQMHALVDPLVQRGFSVVAIDQPGHGASQGTRASMVDFASNILALAKVTGPLAGLVAHSLGSAAALRALDQGLAAERIVFIGAPAHPKRWFDAWVGGVVDPVTAERERLRIEATLGVTFSELEGAHLAASRREPALLIHDRADYEVPIHNAHTLNQAWEGSSVIETEGLGHRRILRDHRVVRAAAGFLEAGHTPDACDHSEDHLPCAPCDFNTALFTRV